jgi:hypothetical protein
MKKTYLARLVLGMTLLGSFLTGYGMESNEVIEKQKGGATQATDKLEQGECFVSKKVFGKCLKGFLKDRSQEGTKQQEALGGLLSKTFGGVFSPEQPAGQEVSNDHHKKHFQTNSPIIKGGLAKDYQETEKWLKDHAGDWLEKAKNFCEENIQADVILDLFKENLEVLKGFLIFLSKERCINQSLEKNLEKIKQGLQSDYKDGKKWLLEEKNLKLWLEKAKQCFQENIQAEDFLDLFKENLEVLKGFLVFLSKEKDDNQELQDQLEKLQGGKEGIFR